MSRTSPCPRLALRAGIGLLAALPIVVAACRGALEPEPSPVTGLGALTLHLRTESPGEGSIQLLVTGGPVDSLDSGQSRFWASVGPDRHRVIVVGDIRPGPLIRIWVPDRGRSDAYEAIVEQVAASYTYEQRDPAEYSLLFERPAVASRVNVRPGS